MAPHAFLGMTGSFLRDDIQLTGMIFLSRGGRSLSSWLLATIRVIKLNVVIKFRGLGRGLCTGFIITTPTPRQAGGRSIVIHHLAGGLVASNNREQWLFELYVVPCAANQQRDFVHAIDHEQRINGCSILIRTRSKSEKKSWHFSYPSAFKYFFSFGRSSLFIAWHISSSCSRLTSRFSFLSFNR